MAGNNEIKYCRQIYKVSHKMLSSVLFCFVFVFFSLVFIHLFVVVFCVCGFLGGRGFEGEGIQQIKWKICVRLPANIEELTSVA
jgi:hypothetical protein